LDFVANISYQIFQCSFHYFGETTEENSFLQGEKMFKKISFAITLLAVLSVLGIATLNYQSSKAGNQKIVDIYKETVSQATNQAPKTPLDILNTLNAKSALSISVPGWVYVKEITQYDANQNNGVLPNGVQIPAAYIIESWSHVNSEGLSFEGVTIMSTLKGDIIQTSISANNQVWNSATNEKEIFSPQPMSPLDSSFLFDVTQSLEKTGKQPEMVTSKLDNKDVITFKLDERPSEPVTTVDSQKAVIGITTNATFDSESGNLINTQRIFTFEDNTEITYYSSEFITEFSVNPPDNILNLIKGGK
jgi:hypothetical protein